MASSPRLRSSATCRRRLRISASAWRRSDSMLASRRLRPSLHLISASSARAWFASVSRCLVAFSSASCSSARRRRWSAFRTASSVKHSTSARRSMCRCFSRSACCVRRCASPALRSWAAASAILLEHFCGNLGVDAKTAAALKGDVLPPFALQTKGRENGAHRARSARNDSVSCRSSVASVSRCLMSSRIRSDFSLGLSTATSKDFGLIADIAFATDFARWALMRAEV
mmetsp:Transcript_107560/g.302801  ORF Transcript_107560/g.302801 Transcript_107560/m.302801 type:complete len:228 (-) Transcript_107560:12-695(-)